MRRLNGRFAKEPRRGVDPAEQRQIEDFIARKGVTKVPEGSGFVWASGNSGVCAPTGLRGWGRVSPRAHAQ